MRDAQPSAIYLKDYRPPAFLIDETHLEFTLDEEQTLVTSRLSLRRNPASDRPTEFTWWTDYGHLVRSTAHALVDTFRVAGWESAVRVRIRNDAGAAYSQPFFVGNPERDRGAHDVHDHRDERRSCCPDAQRPSLSDRGGRAHGSDQRPASGG